MCERKVRLDVRKSLYSKETGPPSMGTRSLVGKVTTVLLCSKENFLAENGTNKMTAMRIGGGKCWLSSKQPLSLTVLVCHIKYSWPTPSLVKTGRAAMLWSFSWSVLSGGIRPYPLSMKREVGNAFIKRQLWTTLDNSLAPVVDPLTP